MSVTELASGVNENLGIGEASAYQRISHLRKGLAFAQISSTAESRRQAYKKGFSVVNSSPYQPADLKMVRAVFRFFRKGQEVPDYRF